jgi:hypothetical protein
MAQATLPSRLGKIIHVYTLQDPHRLDICEVAVLAGGLCAVLRAPLTRVYHFPVIHIPAICIWQVCSAFATSSESALAKP